MTEIITKPLAVQMYGVRREADRDLADVFERIAAMGYLGIEAVGMHGVPANEFRSHLDEFGLEIVGTHVALQTDEERVAAEASLDELQEIGVTTILASLEPQQFESAETFDRALDRTNQFVEVLRSRGMRFGYHNHWWEYGTLDGQQIMSLLLTHLDPEVFMEADVYWMQTAGLDVPATLEGLGPRLRLLHLKDGPCTGEDDPQTAVGTGEVDIPAAVTAAPEVEWHIVEFDECAGNIFDALDASYRYLVSKGISKGAMEVTNS